MSRRKGRQYGQVKTGIWTNPKFRAVPRRAQLCYLMLLSQNALSMCGAIPLLDRRWAAYWCDDDDPRYPTVVAEINEDLRILEQANLIAIDEALMEVLVVGFTEHDGVLEVPNQVKSMWTAWSQMASSRLARIVLERLPGFVFDPDRYNTPAAAMAWFDKEHGTATPGAAQAGMFDPDLSGLDPEPEPSPQGLAQPFPEGFDQGLTERFDPKTPLEGTQDQNPLPDPDTTNPQTRSDLGKHPESNPVANGSGNPSGNPSRNPSDKGCDTPGTRNQEPRTKTKHARNETNSESPLFEPQPDLDPNNPKPFPRGKVPDIAITRVFETWAINANKTAATKLSPARRKLITKALETYPFTDVLDAVVGWKHSAWHTGKNADGKVYNSLELILRNEEKIEQFRDYARGPDQTTAAAKHQNVSYTEADRDRTGGRVYL